MTNKNQKSAEFEESYFKILSDADKVYEAVLSKLEIDQSDDLYLGLVKKMLIRQTKDHLVFACWNSLDDKRANEFRSYISQFSTVAPHLEAETLLIDFVMMQEGLKKNVLLSVNEFLKNFVEKFNRLTAS